ncbi:hypothetical protein O3M35_003197 [Rhynocoris fuscipes]|uniref:TELO2-interacting protein 2 n=1 Tax=Rhynocoris fuscipes TaxID=488301 RepID=A0AAW1CJI9_9HEMI
MNSNDFNDLIEAKKFHVPSIPNAFEKQLDESDFQSYRETCESNLSKINNSLKEKLDNLKVTDELLKHYELPLVHLLILCGEHSCLELWSTKLSVEIAAEILKHLLQLCNKSNVTELLIVNGESIIKNIVLLLRPKLLSSTWKCNPAAVQCYCWILIQIKAPYLDEHLNDLLPTALIITDDFESSNRIKGLRSITHIINNVSKANLEKYGHNGVILAGLRPILYHNEPDILEPLLQCFVSLMQKMESPVSTSELSRNEFDDILDIILNNIDLEGRTQCKIMYLKCLINIINIFRLRTLRYTRKLYSMIETGLYSGPKDPTQLLWLDVLDSIVKNCWPRIINNQHQLHQLMYNILKFTFDYSTSIDVNKISNDDIALRLKTSYQLLKNLCDKKLEEEVNVCLTKSEHLNDNFKTLLHFIVT